MTKIKVISRKPSKNWIFDKNGHFSTLFGQKISNFEFSHGELLLTHPSIHLEKTLGRFQPNLMTKIEVISRKPSKDWIFCKNGNFLTFFGQKIPNFEFSHGYHYSHTLVDT